MITWYVIFDAYRKRVLPNLAALLIRLCFKWLYYVFYGLIFLEHFADAVAVCFGAQETFFIAAFNCSFKCFLFEVVELAD